MLISWNWIKEYVTLDMSVEHLETRLMMAGLNHEGTTRLGDDIAIDLEVTSNRPDCLGHIGVAREVAVLWDQPLRVPEASPEQGQTAASDLATVRIDCQELCGRYTARVVRDVTIGESPQWLVDRLRTIGIATINNVADITNYVMMECGQPLHAFDFAKLAKSQIVVRRARQGEKLIAIDHKTYDLDPSMCVIADAHVPQALAGVMGGAESEIASATTDLLIESARFDPLSTRTTARKLALHSPSSYRFERGVNPQGVDWASRRCCQLILEIAGGELAAGVIDVGGASQARQPIVLRLDQLKRVLGIEIKASDVRKILSALGNEEVKADAIRVEVIPPSWRADLEREIDLVEEVARIHGYDQIPEDVSVPMVPSTRSDEERVLEQVRQVLVALGFYEAMTVSAVEPNWSDTFSPWTDAEPLRCTTPVLRRADRLRRSLVPSLLGARRTNEALANTVIELFEIANVYLPRQEDLPAEERMLSLTSGGDYSAVKGVIETLLTALLRVQDADHRLEVVDTRHPLLDAKRSCELRLGGDVLGYLGEVSAAGMRSFGLRRPTTVAELKLSLLIAAAELVPQHAELSPYPAIGRDRNFVFDEAVRWADVSRIVRKYGGDYLETVQYQDTYCDATKLGEGKKSLLFSMTLRSQEGTLTREEADAICERIDTHLSQELGGRIRT